MDGGEGDMQGYFSSCILVYLTSRLVVITALVAVCAEFLVSAIEDVVAQWHISETFVGLILLPIVGNGKPY